MNWLKALIVGFVAFKIFNKRKESKSTVQDTSSENVDSHKKIIDPIATKAPTFNSLVLRLSDPPPDYRVCIDFGTAMSKATLVRDASEDGLVEEVVVLKLGIPGNQQQISETLLVSSVYIDNKGLLFFGQAAVEKNARDQGSELRQRIDNIKTCLVEGGLQDTIGPPFNPTKLKVTYQDMVIAYLMYLTWAINQCLDEEYEPHNLYRRFAIPCLELSEAKRVITELHKILGEAQILADTFSNCITQGVPLHDFIEILHEIRQKQPSYNFVCDDLITEPLGVASSRLSGDSEKASTMAVTFMVIDVGAGTCDFSMFKIGVPDADGHQFAMELPDTTGCIFKAGTHLDELLKKHMLAKGGVSKDHPQHMKIAGNLDLDIRSYKEALFNEGKTSATFYNDTEVEVELGEFLELNEVKQFSDSLKAKRDEILQAVDINNIPDLQGNRLPIIFTGGGADLPMVKDLAEDRVNIQGKEFMLSQSQLFPDWLSRHYPNLDRDYPMIAVSLGGARKNLVKRYEPRRI